MNIAETISDSKVLLERLASRKPLDPDTYRRIRDRQEAITAELREKHGQMDIAVDLIREVRDES